jgi:hypothetical protein
VCGRFGLWRVWVPGARIQVVGSVVLNGVDWECRTDGGFGGTLGHFIGTKYRIAHA